MNEKQQIALFMLFNTYGCDLEYETYRETQDFRAG